MFDVCGGRQFWQHLITVVVLLLVDAGRYKGGGTSL
jgi:hypothetical protein